MYLAQNASGAFAQEITTLANCLESQLFTDAICEVLFVKLVNVSITSMADWVNDYFFLSYMFLEISIIFSMCRSNLN